MNYHELNVDVMDANCQISILHKASLGLILQMLQLLEPERGKMPEIHQEFQRYHTVASLLSDASAIYGFDVQC